MLCPTLFTINRVTFLYRQKIYELPKRGKGRKCTLCRVYNTNISENQKFSENRSQLSK